MSSLQCLGFLCSCKQWLLSSCDARGFSLPWFLLLQINGSRAQAQELWCLVGRGGCRRHTCGIVPEQGFNTRKSQQCIKWKKNASSCMSEVYKKRTFMIQHQEGNFCNITKKWNKGKNLNLKAQGWTFNWWKEKNSLNLVTILLWIFFESLQTRIEENF